MDFAVRLLATFRFDVPCGALEAQYAMSFGNSIDPFHIWRCDDGTAMLPRVPFEATEGALFCIAQ